MFDFVSAGFCRGNSMGTEQQRRDAMICEGCSIKFSVFKRKRQCSVCQRYYCSHCLPFRQNGGSYNTTSVLAHFTDKKWKCSKCEVLTARPLCRSQLQQLRIKDLQLYLTSQKVSTRGCVEKDDLVNLLMRHAGNSSNNTQRSDFPSDHSSQTDMESGNQSSVMHDRTEQLFQEQSTSTAPYVSAQCVPSTSETPPDSDYLGFSVTSDRSTKTGSGESVTVSSSSSGSQFGHQAPTETNMSGSHEDTCHISTSSSSSSTESSSGWSKDDSVVDVDIVELTDWTGDVSNLDDGPEPMITVIEDESPERTLSEVEVMETDEIVDVAAGIQDDHSITADEPVDETADIATEEPAVTLQACTGITLTSISSLEDLEKLTVKQLKELLLLNRVDYRGCCEKPELMERVTRLWQDSQTRKGLDTTSMDDLCKICMDAPVECVMLECGHMATCVTCGKQLSECPICRQFVVRVVRTFKA